MKKGFVVLLSALLSINILAEAAKARDFNDLSCDHWAYQQIQSLADEMIVVGYPDNSFRPDNPITRAEFATMVVKALKKENSPLAETFYYSDISKKNWAYNTIQVAQMFGLIKGFPDGKFRPNANISKVEAVAIIISSVKTGDMTVEQAREALSAYKDESKIPDWAAVSAGKSENLGITPHSPSSSNLFDPNKKITRAEVAVNIYNMKKVVEKPVQAPPPPPVVLPKKAQGRILDNVSIKDLVAIIPQGTLIPATLVTSVNSQKSQKGDTFSAKINDNLISKENDLLISKDSVINGEITQIKPARYFIRNAELSLNTQTIHTVQDENADLPGAVVQEKPVKKGFFARIISYVLKGEKIKLFEGNEINVMLDTPVAVDLSTTKILKNPAL